jgi:hypothetical protein
LAAFGDQKREQRQCPQLKQDEIFYRKMFVQRRRGQPAESTNFIDRKRARIASSAGLFSSSTMSRWPWNWRVIFSEQRFQVRVAASVKEGKPYRNQIPRSTLSSPISVCQMKMVFNGVSQENLRLLTFPQLSLPVARNMTGFAPLKTPLTI